MKENMSIVLEAITSKFKAQMQEAGNFGQKVANRVKQAWTIEPKINTKNLSTMQLQTKGLKEALSPQNRVIDFTASAYVKGVKMYSSELSNANTKAILLKNNVKEVVNEAKKGFIGFSTMGKGINTMGKHIESATKRVLRYGTAMLSIRGIFGLVRKASSAYLAQDTDLANKLQSAWTGLGAFLAPLIEWIANKILKLVKYMNIFIKAVTGQDLLAKASAKATKKINDQAKATKKLNRSLSEMDEITNIMDESGDKDKSLPENPFANFDDVELDTTWADRIKKFGEWVIENWKEVLAILAGTAFIIEGIKLALKGSEFLTFARILAGIGVTIIGLTVFFINLKKYIDDVKKGIEDSAKGWKHFGGIIAGIGLVIVGIGIIIGGIPAIIVGVVVTILGIVAAFWPKITESIEKFKIWLLGFTQKLFGKTIGDMITAPFFDVVDVIMSVFNGLFRGIKNIVTGIIRIFQGDLKGGLTKIAKGIGNIFIGVINGITSGINMTLAPMRALIVAAGKVMGKNFTMNNIKIPKIPYLATGTNYVPEDQLAYIHKGEAVVPKKFNSAEYFNNINNNEETNALLMDVNRTLLDILDKDTTLNVNGKELARATYNDFKNEENRLGKSSVVNVR